MELSLCLWAAPVHQITDGDAVLILLTGHSDLVLSGAADPIWAHCRMLRFENQIGVWCRQTDRVPGTVGLVLPDGALARIEDGNTKLAITVSLPIGIPKNTQYCSRYSYIQSTRAALCERF